MEEALVPSTERVLEADRRSLLRARLDDDFGAPAQHFDLHLLPPEQPGLAIAHDLDVDDLAFDEPTGVFGQVGV